MKFNAKNDHVRPSRKLHSGITSDIHAPSQKVSSGTIEKFVQGPPIDFASKIKISKDFAGLNFVTNQTIMFHKFCASAEHAVLM